MRSFIDRVSSLAGPLCLLPALVISGLWIVAVNRSSAQTERVSYYLSFFPRGTDVYQLALIVFVSCLLAIVFSVLGFRKRSFGHAAGADWRGDLVQPLHIATIVMASIIGFLNFFQFM